MPRRPRAQQPPRPLSQPSGRISALFAFALLKLASLLPERALARLASGLGRLAFRLGIRRRVALDNLRHAFPEQTEAWRLEIARGAYANMARAAVEGLRGGGLSREGVERAVAVERWGELAAALSANRGVLVASAHFGSWELFAEVMARRGIRMSAVVRPLRGSINARLVEARRQSGLGLIAARGALQGMLRALRGGEAVVMLLDQAIPAEQAVFVPFFGRLASTSPALAVAALRTGAPVFVVMAAREGDRLRMFVDGPIAAPEGGPLQERVRELTARIVSVLEGYIRRYPDQWLWLHRRWKSAPPQTPGADPLPGISAGARPAE